MPIPAIADRIIILNLEVKVKQNNFDGMNFESIFAPAMNKVIYTKRTKKPV
jgi:hypothetical protein